MSVFGQELKKDFSGERRIPWQLWLAVLALHAIALTGLNAVLTLNRLAAQAEQSFDVAILPNDAPKPTPNPLPKPQPPKAESPEPAKPADEPTAPVALVVPALPEPVVQPNAAPDPAATAPAVATPLPVIQAVPEFRAVPPASVMLRYILTKGNDSAKASLLWRPSNPSGPGTNTDYEMIYEATYFGISIIKQTSTGVLSGTGLAPTRFSDKRRGKSEQAAHFERDKSLITFSNNRPEAKLVAGAQDRASFLIQLASLYAGQAEKFKTGDSIEVPVVSSDELEMWAFEVQASESIQLPIGETQAIKLLRRPRRSFDATVEVWVAPSHGYLPVRIRQTDSGGVTDSQLSSKELP